MFSKKEFVEKFRPAIETRDGEFVHQFRGLRYGTVSARFAEAEAFVYDLSVDGVDSTKFGPICPQLPIDYHHLLRVPEIVAAQELPTHQDEFACLNLDITKPAAPGQQLPVLIWIHGGSQVMTFVPASSPCGDTVPFVVNSIKQQTPVIVVFVNYRLNIFAFGNGKGSKNLALKDQRLAIDWVVQNIEAFGGDPNNITLGGESAGAVYVHAHMATGAPVQRTILQSGSLYLSPPQDVSRGDVLCKNLESILGRDGLELANAPVDKVLNTLEEANVVSMWLQLTADLQGWETRDSPIKEVLIGDVEYESIIWRNGIESLTAAEIAACFDSATEYASELKRIYNIVVDRPTSCKLGALDFINDIRFAYPVMLMQDTFCQQGKTVFKYVFDEFNPWQASARAHHAVEIVMLFGRIDWTGQPGARAVQRDIRDKWLSYCHGETPWEEQRTYAFGPYGNCGSIADSEYRRRRRVDACMMLQQMGYDKAGQVFGKLAAGRISLLN